MKTHEEPASATRARAQSDVDIRKILLQGQFTVLSISGAVLHEHGDPSNGDPKVFLSASLANPTGGVVGGTVAGPMEAHGSAMVCVC